VRLYQGSVRLCGLLCLGLASACTLVAGLGPPKVYGGGLDTSVQAVSIAVGNSHACAVIQGSEGSADNGTVRCWGSNMVGELGSDPVLVASSVEPLPVAPTAVPLNAFALTLGAEYSCATTSGPTDAYFFCWGSIPQVSAAGVHPGPSSAAYVPSEMYLHNSPLVSVDAAAVGDNGGCVVTGTAPKTSLVCWGTTTISGPECGQSGISCFDGGGVGILPDAFQSVAAGRSHTCGIATRQGATDVECWGDNTYGQAGSQDQMTVGYPNPVGVGGYGSITSVACGGNHACALLADGSVYCWGQNDKGQLGDPMHSGDSASPVLVALAPDANGKPLTAVEIAVGDDHACAVMSDESTQCWGDNSTGQLGNGAEGAFESSPASVQRVLGGLVQPVPRGNLIAAGGGTTCLIRYGDPQVWCWGANEFGQAGQETGGQPVLYATPMAW
jgi:alpha-tubulin suppressor-like RCC1 family protein